MDVDEDEYFASLGGSLMKDLLADLAVGDGDFSLEQLEKELSTLDRDFNYEVGDAAPPGLSAASLVVSAQGQSNDGAEVNTGAPGQSSLDAWSLSLEKFTAMSLEEDFLAADSVRKQQLQSPVASTMLSDDEMRSVEDYDVLEKPMLAPPPGMATSAAAGDASNKTDSKSLLSPTDLLSEATKKAEDGEQKQKQKQRAQDVGPTHVAGAAPVQVNIVEQTIEGLVKNQTIPDQAQAQAAKASEEEAKHEPAEPSSASQAMPPGAPAATSQPPPPNMGGQGPVVMPPFAMHPGHHPGQHPGHHPMQHHPHMQHMAPGMMPPPMLHGMPPHMMPHGVPVPFPPQMAMPGIVAMPMHPMQPPPPHGHGPAHSNQQPPQHIQIPMQRGMPPQAQMQVQMQPGMPGPMSMPGSAPMQAPVPVPPQAQSQVQTQGPAPMRKMPFCNIHPAAPPILAADITSSAMAARDISFVVHAIMKPILLQEQTGDDYFSNFMLKRFSAPKVKPRQSPDDNAMSKEMLSRALKSKEWASGKPVLGHTKKADTFRPRALIATSAKPTAPDSASKQRSSLWKARIICDQVQQAFHNVVKIWDSSPQGRAMPQMQPHLMKIMKCLGMTMIDTEYLVDVEAVKLFLKLGKGRALLARILERAILPPNAVQALLPGVFGVLLSMDYEADETDDRIFGAISRVVQNLDLSGPCLLSTVYEVQANARAALSTSVRMQCVHSLLQKGSQKFEKESSKDLQAEWSEAESEFLKILQTI